MMVTMTNAIRSVNRSQLSPVDRIREISVQGLKLSEQVVPGVCEYAASRDQEQSAWSDCQLKGFTVPVHRKGKLASPLHRVCMAI